MEQPEVMLSYLEEMGGSVKLMQEKMKELQQLIGTVRAQVKVSCQQCDKALRNNNCLSCRCESCWTGWSYRNRCVYCNRTAEESAQRLNKNQQQLWSIGDDQIHTCSKCGFLNRNVYRPPRTLNCLKCKAELEDSSDEETQQKAQEEQIKPKKARSGYMWFCKENRPVQVDAHPDARFGEITKLMAKAWSEMSDDSKQPYQDLHMLDKERFSDEMSELKATGRFTVRDNVDGTLTNRSQPAKRPAKRPS